MIELKPCPFCGNKEPDLIRYYDGEIEVCSTVVCDKCGASVQRVNASSAEDNIAVWNRRTDRDGAR